MSDEVQVPANAAQAAGEHRIAHADLFEAEVRPHTERFRAAADVRPRDRVLDIGCGTGPSTRYAARAAVAGSVLGVDISGPVLEYARRISRQEGLRNVTYEQADAQVHRFRPACFDLGISEFGVMFFADPVSAFANIGRALRPGGRLALLVWQAQDSNEWSSAVRQALAGEGLAGEGLADPAEGGQLPFSLADPARTQGILTAAGFAEVSFTDMHEPVWYGPDSATAYDFTLGLHNPRDLLARLDAAAAEAARERLRVMLAAHDTGRGVFFDARAWIITARRL